MLSGAETEILLTSVVSTGEATAKAAKRIEPMREKCMAIQNDRIRIDQPFSTPLTLCRKNSDGSLGPIRMQRDSIIHPGIEFGEGDTRRNMS